MLCLFLHCHSKTETLNRTVGVDFVLKVQEGGLCARGGVYLQDTTICIRESVDSLSTDGMDTQYTENLCRNPTVCHTNVVKADKAPSNCV